MQNLLKGLFISILLLAGFSIFYWQIGISGFDELGALAFLIPAFPIIGVILGFAATKIKTKRFLKLLGLSLLLVYVAAVILSAVLVMTDNSKPMQTGEIISSVLFLSTVGFFVYSVFLLPVLLIGIYILEKWTRVSE